MARPDPARLPRWIVGGVHITEQSEEHSFLLLKPDCLRAGRTRAVERAVASAGLRIGDRHEIVLTPADVRALWAEYDEGGHSLTLAFLDRYLTTGPSEVLLLSGPDAFESARRIKREIRSEFAAGPFANVLHAAEQRSELARQHAHLTGRAGSRPETVPERPRGLDFRVLCDVPALVDEVWPLIQGEPVFPGPFRWEAETGRAVFLGPDRGHTLDSTVTALWRALPGIEPAHAVRLVLHCGFSGGSPIAVGGRSTVRRILRALRDQGIRNCGTGDWQPAR